MAEPVDEAVTRPWLSLTQAATQSGRHVGALRSLVRRGRLPARKGNQGQWLVQLPEAELLAKSDAAIGLATDMATGASGLATGEAMAELLAEVAELRELLARAEAERAAAESVAEAQVAAARDTATAQIEAARDTATARVNLAKLEIAAVRELADRLTAELADARRELADARRPWIARVLAAILWPRD